MSPRLTFPRRILLYASALVPATNLIVFCRHPHVGLRVTLAASDLEIVIVAGVLAYWPI